MSRVDARRGTMKSSEFFERVLDCAVEDHVTRPRFLLFPHLRRRQESSKTFFSLTHPFRLMHFKLFHGELDSDLLLFLVHSSLLSLSWVFRYYLLQTYSRLRLVFIRARVVIYSSTH